MCKEICVWKPGIPGGIAGKNTPASVMTQDVKVRSQGWEDRL